MIGHHSTFPQVIGYVEDDRFGMGTITATPERCVRMSDGTVWRQEPQVITIEAQHAKPTAPVERPKNRHDRRREAALKRQR